MVIVQLTSNELESLIQDSVRRAIDGYYHHSAQLPDLLTRAQAANQLSCSPGTIDNYVKSGILDKVVLGPRRVRFRKEQFRN